MGTGGVDNPRVSFSHRLFVGLALRGAVHQLTPARTSPTQVGFPSGDCPRMCRRRRWRGRPSTVSHPRHGYLSMEAQEEVVAPLALYGRPGVGSRAVRAAIAQRTYNAICRPTSRNWSGGRSKRSGARTALRYIAANSMRRHGASLGGLALRTTSSWEAK
jgi:hypothetical protein